MTVKWSGRSFGHISRYSAATPIAALTLNFLTTTSLDSRITFTRASSATRVNASGVIESVTANTPRFDYDPVTLAPRGLLIEEQRTNLVTYSDRFDNAPWLQSQVSVAANATTAPDGTTSADKLIESTANSLHTLIGSATTTAAPHTWSCYIKSAERTFAFLYHSESNSAVSINLSTGATGTPSGTVAPTASTVTSVGNGWYRLTMTATATAASNSFRIYVATSLTGSAVYTGDGTSGIFVWGAQLEAGAFATSYIPTVASQVTRTADVAAITGANFSQWYNQSEGTFVASYSTLELTSGANRAIVAASDGTTSNRLYTYVASSSSAPTLLATTFSASQASIANSAISNNTIVKTASAYKADDFAIVTNGGSAATDTAGSVPSVNRCDIGYLSSVGLTQLNGHIRSIRYYPTRLSNAQLQALTA